MDQISINRLENSYMVPIPNWINSFGMLITVLMIFSIRQSLDRSCGIYRIFVTWKQGRS
jgi:hypothetical protein